MLIFEVVSHIKGRIFCISMIDLKNSLNLIFLMIHYVHELMLRKDAHLELLLEGVVIVFYLESHCVILVLFWADDVREPPLTVIVLYYK